MGPKLYVNTTKQWHCRKCDNCGWFLPDPSITERFPLLGCKLLNVSHGVTILKLQVDSNNRPVTGVRLSSWDPAALAEYNSRHLDVCLSGLKVSSIEISSSLIFNKLLCVHLLHINTLIVNGVE
uniref:Uncharacterized protein n=1 Tax=Cucumis melo TaxID=3656 RepID=A0A9I9E4B9_CUCME